MNKIKATDFFNNDYVNHASYDNLRKIASLVDGQKNAARKVLYTVLEKNIKEKIKVSQLGSKVAEFAEYLHGNMDGVIVNLAQDYIGTNNISLLQKKGNFGTRFSPEASASRYIYTYGSADFFNFFKKEDIPILKHQTFEGNKIEPLFYVPSIPILLINGSEGVSSGFAQKILPRNPDKLKLYIRKVLNSEEIKKPSVFFKPFYNGFNGIIEEGETSNQWIIKGKIKKLGINKIEISEIPIGYNLKGYLKVLDDLEDQKIIQSYQDKSENDNFLFHVNIISKNLNKWNDEIILQKLKLVKTISENYTCINEENKIQVFSTPQEIINQYIKVKLEYIQKRKNYQIQEITSEIQFNYSKYLFIKNIVDDKLKINKRKKIDIIRDLEQIPKILKKDDSFDYLLNMNILSLTKEKMEKLQEDIKNKKLELDELKNKSINQIWLDEL